MLPIFAQSQWAQSDSDREAYILTKPKTIWETILFINYADYLNLPHLDPGLSEYLKHAHN